MKTMISRLNEWDEMIFRLFNQHFYRRSLYVLLTKITHLGGARITIFTLLLLLVFGKDPYQTLAKAAAFSLFISHIPVQIGKHLFRRDRPYLTLSNTFVVKNPLKDHSFPSGHSTAIFAATTPFYGWDSHSYLYIVTPFFTCCFFKDFFRTPLPKRCHCWYIIRLYHWDHLFFFIPFINIYKKITSLVGSDFLHYASSFKISALSVRSQGTSRSVTSEVTISSCLMVDWTTQDQAL